MDNRVFLLKALKKSYRTIFRPNFIPDGVKNLDRQDANDRIYQLLMNDKPCMVTRFGTTEIGILTNYLTVHAPTPFFKKCFNYITDNTGLPWWDNLYVEKCKWASGIFPQTIETLEKFSLRYFDDIPLIDLLGSFNYTEKFMPLSKEVQLVHLETLYPFFVDTPWTKALEGKRVLVIHPFSETIKSQYSRKHLLFDNSDILPNYELIVLKAVQSGAGAECEFKDWFEALKYMEDEIDRINFDIAILGCGAYGLPLAAHIKRIGKKAVHIGGGTQLLFGIKGKRWEDGYHGPHTPSDYDSDYRKLFNEYWVRPLKEETPTGAGTVEGACYW